MWVVNVGVDQIIFHLKVQDLLQTVIIVFN